MCEEIILPDDVLLEIRRDQRVVFLTKLLEPVRPRGILVPALSVQNYRDHFERTAVRCCFERREMFPALPLRLVEVAKASSLMRQSTSGEQLRNQFSRALLCAMKSLATGVSILSIWMFAYAQENTTPPPRVYPVALPNYDEETATRLQIFLDNSDFGPGKIDGKMGEFFRKALISYKHAHAMPKTGAVDQWMLDQVPVTYATYTIREEDLKLIGDVPGSRAEQARLKWLPYTSLLEFVAERFHSAETFIQRLNPGKNWEHLQPGETLKVPNVLPFEVEKFSEGKVPENPAFAKRKIFVDTHEHLLEVFDHDQLVCVFPITPGSKALPAPVGTWKILGASVWPWFRYDEGMLNYGVRTENYYNLPPGPNNLVGILWMGLNKPGIGIHGTNNPETIGRAASHGCIRLANWDAARVKDLVSVGNTVIIF